MKPHSVLSAWAKTRGKLSSLDIDMEFVYAIVSPDEPRKSNG